MGTVLILKRSMKICTLCICLLSKLLVAESGRFDGSTNNYLQRLRGYDSMGDLTNLLLPWSSNSAPAKRAPIHLWRKRSSELADEHPKLYTAEELLQLMNQEEESF